MDVVVDGLTKDFGAIRALEAIDARIGAGERVALIGPNGSGKTSLLRCIAAVDRPSAGQVRIGGKSVRSNRLAITREMGYVGHETMLYDAMTARENLRFHARLRGISPSRVESVLAAVALADRASGRPVEFSHGMRKRLSFARALLDAPGILLLDEPVAGLDQQSTDIIADCFDDRTVVLATHELEFARRTCHRLVFLDRGRIVAREDTDTFRDRQSVLDHYHAVIA